jgi:hypothetical protein
VFEYVYGRDHLSACAKSLGCLSTRLSGIKNVISKAVNGTFSVEKKNFFWNLGKAGSGRNYPEPTVRKDGL